MINTSELIRALRGLMGAVSDAPVLPRALATQLRLRTRMESRGRVGLYADGTIYVDELAPREEQDYQIARAACAWWLTQAGLIFEVSPHFVAMELCGVAAPRPGLRKAAPVISLARARLRRSGGMR